VRAGTSPSSIPNPVPSYGRPSPSCLTRTRQLKALLTVCSRSLQRTNVPSSSVPLSPSRRVESHSTPRLHRPPNPLGTRRTEGRSLLSPGLMTSSPVLSLRRFRSKTNPVSLPSKQGLSLQEKLTPRSSSSRLWCSDQGTTRDHAVRGVCFVIEITFKAF
jgi:hypothetical protein